MRIHILQAKPYLLAVMLAVCTAAPAGADERSPFTAVNVSAGRVIVVFQKMNAELISINGRNTQDILTFCRKTYGEKAEKRFAEDLVDVLTRMGMKPGETVRLLIKDVDKGQPHVVAAAAMTAANRKQVVLNRTERRQREPRDQEDVLERSPFTDVVFDGASPIVKFKGIMYELQSIDGLSAAHIVDFCKRTYQTKWQERFGEDLVQTLARMDHRPGDSVRLVLKNRLTGELLTVPSAAMTRENRQRVRDTFNEREDRRQQRLDPQELLNDIDAFEDILRNRWSYFRASDQSLIRGGDVDFATALSKLRNQCQQPMPRHEFSLHLMRIIALGIDGHASVSHLELPGGYTPFLVEPSQSRFVALRPDRNGFLDDRHPFIDQIDGNPLQKWLEAASQLVSNGSPQFVRRHSLRYLRDIIWVRRGLGLKTDTPLRVRLVSGDRKSTREIELAAAVKRPLYGQWPRSTSRLLGGNIGYVRLRKMSDQAEAEVHRRMKQFRNTRGLIIDVRDNSGGTRGPLRALSAYLLSADDTPRVVNVARYRLHPERDADHLHARFLFPADSAHWSTAERRAITEFADTFQPRWEPPPSEFSSPHYMVLSPLDHSDVYLYERSVVVLMNEKCFSATDIFLAGLKGCRNVTLIGTPSSGGSARSERHKLSNSDIDVTVGSMVSWQINGQLFDGHGVQPDITVEPDPEYFIGGADRALARAVNVIAAR